MACLLARTLGGQNPEQARRMSLTRPTPPPWYVPPPADLQLGVLFGPEERDGNVRGQVRGASWPRQAAGQPASACLLAPSEGVQRSTHHTASEAAGISPGARAQWCTAAGHAMPYHTSRPCLPCTLPSADLLNTPTGGLPTHTPPGNHPAWQPPTAPQPPHPPSPTHHTRDGVQAHAGTQAWEHDPRHAIPHRVSTSFGMTCIYLHR